MAGDRPSVPGRVTLRGSNREAPSDPRIGDPDLTELVELSLYLRPRAAVDWVDAEALRSPAERRIMSRDDFAAAHGASPEDVEAIREFANDHALEVVEVDIGRRFVSLRGTLDAAAKAFGASALGRFRGTDGEYRGLQGPLSVPAALEPMITGVFGFDQRPLVPRRTVQLRPLGDDPGYTAVDVAKAYSFPSNLTGAGQTVAVIAIQGGFTQADLDTYFQGLGLPAPVPTPVVVSGPGNVPGGVDLDTEVMMDIEVIGATAPGARIVVYFTNNNDGDIVNAVSTAIHDTTNRPSVISISIGASEDGWNFSSRVSLDAMFLEAAGLGITVTAASGDHGSANVPVDGKQHVLFPASSSYVLACGGTNLTLNNGTITSEVVWNDATGATGGGVSECFEPPAYQANAGVPRNVDTGLAGRGVPDVSAPAAEHWRIQVDGGTYLCGGTSAAAPLWAGLIARFNQGNGRPVGQVHAQLYAGRGALAFYDVREGNNGAYAAGPGWDACTGLGTPSGTMLANALFAGFGPGPVPVFGCTLAGDEPASALIDGMFEAWYLGANGGHQVWQSLGKPSSGDIAAPFGLVTDTTTNSTYVFVCGAETHPWLCLNGTWIDIGIPAAGVGVQRWLGPMAVQLGNGVIGVYALGTDGNLWRLICQPGSPPQFSWQPLGTPTGQSLPTGIYHQALVPQNGTAAFVVASGQLWKWQDQWQPAPPTPAQGLRIYYLVGAIALPDGGHDVYAVCQLADGSLHLWLSNDTWTECGIPGQAGEPVAVVPGPDAASAVVFMMAIPPGQQLPQLCCWDRATNTWVWLGNPPGAQLVSPLGALLMPTSGSYPAGPTAFVLSDSNQVRRCSRINGNWTWGTLQP